VADNGSVAVASRSDPQNRAVDFFDYELHTLANGHTRPDAEPAGSIAMDGIRRLEFIPHGQMAAALTDKEFYFVRLHPNGPEQFPYLPGKGLVFLDAAVACSDPRRTLAFVLQDRSTASFTLTAAEAKDKLTPIWAKSWNHPISCIAISADGDWLAVGHANGAISLLDRGRRMRWEYAGATGRPISSLAVDCAGSVVAADPAGEVRRHEAHEGGVIWRAQLSEHGAPDQAQGARVSYRVTLDRNSRIIGVAMAVLTQNATDFDGSRYYLFDGATGAVLWDDSIGPRPTGIAISPSGEFMAISTLSSLQLFSIKLNGKRTEKTPVLPGQKSAVEKARKEAVDGRYFASLPILLEALDANPTNIEAAALHEEVAWALRESVMELTTQTTPESLAMVEAALRLLPHNEKLTVRRNALARILASKRFDEAERLVSLGQYRDAIAAYQESLRLDTSFIESRRGIVKTEERILRGLLQKVQTTISEAKWDAALDFLEEAHALRPNNPDIAAMIAGIQRDQAFADGMRYFTAQRYLEAAFLFKRTLMFDPGHMEAARHLSLSESHLRQSAESEPKQAVGSVADRRQAPR
jgi:tetratricopeptide (TPR) repeat protein